ncbi:(2Fe-2S)-binding protein [Candidatus Peregrinibacteria bacterium]|nr:MAG: (2Fe-2S)-binding protein [Candidatus Peregrinibacteria bacterium]
MKKKVSIFIDGKEIQTEEGKNILQIAIENDIPIPHFCYHEDMEVEANCRACLVLLEDTKRIETSCTVPASEGLRIHTTSPKIERLRKKNMELLLASHRKLCPKCQKGDWCKVADTIDKYHIPENKYVRRRVGRAIHKMGTAAEFDPELCIACNKCVKACDRIGIHFLELSGKNTKTRVDYNKDPKVDCIYCGQCTVVCPVNAIREQGHIEQVEAAIADPDKIVIVQTAPSVRASIGEEFGAPYGTDLTGKMYTAYRLLGFDKIFDVNFGADITTIVEAEELIERIHSGEGLPMFTSCCPGWVKYLEYYHPELIPHLTTARSPQMHSGGAYKTWWAEKEGVDPKRIVVVSVMPCTSKKYEAQHEKMKIDGMFPVDYSLTTRELAVLLKKHNIDLPSLEPSEVDRYGIHTGAAVIYGASGGVMESALRTAYRMITGENLKNVELTEVRGMKGVKRAVISIGKMKVKVGVVAMPKNIRKVLKAIKENPSLFDYLEFMACPGGCIGGGGQPNPSSDRIIKKRIAGIYGIDRKMTMRNAHENPIVQEYFEYLKTIPEEKRKSLLYTSYSPKRKFE